MTAAESYMWLKSLCEGNTYDSDALLEYLKATHDLEEFDIKYSVERNKKLKEMKDLEGKILNSIGGKKK